MTDLYDTNEHDSGPIVIIGKHDSIFVKMLAQQWYRRGQRVLVVDGTMLLREMSEDGMLVVRSLSGYSLTKKVILRVLWGILRVLERFFRVAQRSRLENAMRAMGTEFRPSIVAPILNGIVLSSAIKHLCPQFVFAHNAFFYGFAAALCNCTRVIFPWGADIYHYAETTSLAYHLVRWSLSRADLVCPTSGSAADHIVSRFKIHSSRVRAISWGVDTDFFRHADSVKRKKLCGIYGIPEDCIIVTNARRFAPGWGSDTVLKAFLDLAKKDHRYHFVLFGGGSSTHLAEAKSIIQRAGLAERFTIFEEEITLESYSEILSITSIFISLMRLTDMRSSSVLQAAAAGAAPVLSNQPEYQRMIQEGFRARIVEIDNHAEVIDAIEFYADNPCALEEITSNNLAYVMRQERFASQMNSLWLAIQTAVAKKHTL